MSDGTQPHGGLDASAARRPIVEACSVIRTKNAGPFIFTCDIMFRDEAAYRSALASGALSRQTVAEAYGISADEVLVFETCDDLFAIKASIKRRRPSGAPGDSDCYAMNQEGPLLRLMIPA